MIDVITDFLFPLLRLEDVRETIKEIEYSPGGFVNSLKNRLVAEVERREELLLDRNLCPKCENELSTLYANEWHEVWGHRQLCRVPDGSVCSCCGWKEG